MNKVLIVATFLRTPARTEALGLILLRALLIWRLIEQQMRWHLEQTHDTVPGRDNKLTQRPTAYMMAIKPTRTYSRRPLAYATRTDLCVTRATGQVSAAAIC